MDQSKTTPALLAEKVLKHLNESVSSKKLDTDGAKNAAEIIDQFLIDPGEDI